MADLQKKVRFFYLAAGPSPAISHGFARDTAGAS